MHSPRHAAQGACFGARQLPAVWEAGHQTDAAISANVACVISELILHADGIEASYSMRLIPLIVPAILLCLLVPVVRWTAHAVASRSASSETFSLTRVLTTFGPG